MTQKPMTMKTTADRRDQANKQRRRLGLALALLFMALVAVIVKDRQFWFGGNDSALDSEDATPQVAQKVAQQPTKATTAQAAKTAPAAKKPVAVAKNPAASNSAASVGPSITGTRTVLAPLDVEVVAGDSHHTVRPGSNATNVEITKPESSDAAFAGAKSAAERERLSATTGSYQATYPLLAQHMNVEGSVVLQALISADGIIQNLHVLSGPAILATAAQQAVREWKFKPVVENGQAVETKATITVNFAIKVADNAKDEIASSQPLRYSYTADGASR